MRTTRLLIAYALGLLLVPATSADDNTAPEGFVSLFNGKDLTGWKIPDGDGGHWKVSDGVIDYDAGSEASGDKALWSDGRISRLHPPDRLAAQGSAVHQQEHSLYPCPMERTPRTSTARS